jgi:hypothetical protein
LIRSLAAFTPDIPQPRADVSTSVTAYRETR